MTSREIRNKLEQKKGKRDQLQKDLKREEKWIKQQKRNLSRHEKALEVVRQVGLKTQQQLQYHISGIASLALEAVFDNPYELKVEFIQRRNKTECDLYFTRDGYRIDPLDEGGGGAADIASFALRAASWSMQSPKTRPVLLLDEPFKHLKGEERNLKVLEMVKQISEKLGIQIIMVSDERISRQATVDVADRLFEVDIKDGVSQIKIEK